MASIYQTSVLYDYEKDIMYQSQSYGIELDILEEQLVFVDKKDVFRHRQTLLEKISQDILGDWERWVELADNNPLLHSFDICENMFISVPPQVREDTSYSFQSKILLGERQ